MTPTLTTYLIVCPLLFLAGVIDAIAGGGGLISLPAYLIAGLPTHQAIATNKMGATFGTTLTTVRFFQNGLINIKLAVPSVAAAIIGSSLGTQISLHMDEKLLQNIMLVVLPVVAFFVLNKKIFKDLGEVEIHLDKRTVTVAVLSAFFVGIYDGLYGPGTGTFLIIAFTVFGRLGMIQANGQAKIINTTTNWTSLILNLINGSVLLPLGICSALANMLGNYVGSGLAMHKGSAIVKPAILLVLLLLFLKVLGIY